jgi:Cu/Ag efflux protein CusF
MKNIALLLSALFLASLAPASPALAAAASAKSSQADSRSTGQVKKIDLAAGKVTLAHGPLVNLNMPAMTMSFLVKDRQQLEGLKAGDKVSFVAEEINGRLTASALQVTP